MSAAARKRVNSTGRLNVGNWNSINYPSPVADDLIKSWKIDIHELLINRKLKLSECWRGSFARFVKLENNFHVEITNQSVWLEVRLETTLKVFSAYHFNKYLNNVKLRNMPRTRSWKAHKMWHKLMVALKGKREQSKTILYDDIESMAFHLSSFYLAVKSIMNYSAYEIYIAHSSRFHFHFPEKQKALKLSETFEVGIRLNQIWK